jgi:polysaccharide export outer membrane protein
MNEDMIMKLHPIKLKGLYLLLAGLLLAVNGGCSTTKALPASAAPAPKVVPSVLEAGDTVELKFFYANELNVAQTIRSDGMITLELVGDVQAAGLTPSGLAANLRQLYSVDLKHPDVAVFLRTSYSRRVFVAGSVVRPSTLDMPGNLSALEAVMMAGGFNLSTANPSQVLVMRDDGKQGRIAYLVDMSGTLKGAPSKSFMLQPEDIVYVPRTRITALDQFVAQYINGLVPDGIVYTHNVGHETFGVQNSTSNGLAQ